MCPHTAILVSSKCYIRVLTLQYVCPHINAYLSCRQFTDWGLANFLRALAEMKRVVGKRMLALLERRVEEISGDFSAHNISNTMWALAVMKITPGERMLELLEGRVEIISEEFVSHQISNTLWAFVTLKRMPGERMLGLLERQAGAKSGGFKPEDISITLWAFASLMRTPGERVMALLEQRVEQVSGQLCMRLLVYEALNYYEAPACRSSSPNIRCPGIRLSVTNAHSVFEI